jgi:hypothetical protein
MPTVRLVASATLTTADLGELESAVRQIKRFVRDARPGRASGDQARRAVALLAEVERAASSGIALLSPVVIETGTYAKDGHGSAASWLASLSGSSPGAAKGRLAAAQRASASPEIADALRDADLSSSQIKLLADAAAPGELLEMLSGGSSHQELSDTVARQRAAARCRESELARRARVHANRHFRWAQADGGGIRGEFLCDEVAWAKVNARLEAEAQRRWKAAGSHCADDIAAHRLDAFLDLLANGRGAPASGDPLCVVLVDAEALKRGTTTAGELCEIDGVGPISVDAASELLFDGAAQFMLRSAKNICSVTSRSRYVAQRLSMTLVARDRKCAVPNCGETRRLQGDHRITDYAQGGLTELGNLARLCPSHHDMKTHGGWNLEGGPGHWQWVSPANPPTAGTIVRTRKLAMAKAKSVRNRPRRT